MTLRDSPIFLFWITYHLKHFTYMLRVVNVEKRMTSLMPIFLRSSCSGSAGSGIDRNLTKLHYLAWSNESSQPLCNYGYMAGWETNLSGGGRVYFTDEWKGSVYVGVPGKRASSKVRHRNEGCLGMEKRPGCQSGIWHEGSWCYRPGMRRETRDWNCSYPSLNAE
jgi:hypothetical protein